MVKVQLSYRDNLYLKMRRCSLIIFVISFLFCTFLVFSFGIAFKVYVNFDHYGEKVMKRSKFPSTWRPCFFRVVT